MKSIEFKNITKWQKVSNQCAQSLVFVFVKSINLTIYT